MKNKFTFILLFQLFFSFQMIAQMNKGDFFIEGDISYSLENREEERPYTFTQGQEVTRLFLYKQMNFSFSTNAGYAILENLSVGLSYQFMTFKNYSKVKRENLFYKTNETKNNSNSLGLFLKKYTQLIGQFYLSNQFNIVFEKQKILEDKYSPYISISSLSFSPSYIPQNFIHHSNNLHLILATSLFFKVKNRFGIQVQLVEVQSNFGLKDSRGDEYGENSFGVTLNPRSWRYGFVLIFGNKTKHSQT